MKLIISDTDVTELAIKVTTSGTKKECARTLKADILQSPSDSNIPTVSIDEGMPVVFTADGQYFVGAITEVSRSTSSSNVSVTAKDHGIHLTTNKITAKVKNLTPPAAAAQIAAQAGIVLGDAAAAELKLTKKYVDATVYDALMAGYVLDSRRSGNKYFLILDGTSVCIRRRGTCIAAVIESGVNLIDAAYSESRGTEELERKATVQNTGNADCITGNAVLVKEEYTGLYGLFFIDGDTHTWQKGLYTNKLTLAWENTMDETSAKAAKAAGGKRATTTTGTASGKIIFTKPDGTPYED